MLMDEGVLLEDKGFAMGVRAEHPQALINKLMYHDPSPELVQLLGNASYSLVTQVQGRGVYSFCMCPGGYVVNASSEEGRLAINGMSYYKRDSMNANSAIVVTVDNRDFGSHPLDGIKFQRELESITYKKGNGFIPVQLYNDFKYNKESNRRFQERIT